MTNLANKKSLIDISDSPKWKRKRSLSYDKLLFYDFIYQRKPILTFPVSSQKSFAHFVQGLIDRYNTNIIRI